MTPPINPSILFFGETDFSNGLLPKLTPKTYAAESEIQIRDKKQKTIKGLYVPETLDIEKKITRDPTK